MGVDPPREPHKKRRRTKKQNEKELEDEED
jgi:hypothetical protein